MSATNTLEKQRCYVMDETMGKPCIYMFKYRCNSQWVPSISPPAASQFPLHRTFRPPKKGLRKKEINITTTQNKPESVVNK